MKIFTCVLWAVLLWEVAARPTPTTEEITPKEKTRMRQHKQEPWEINKNLGLGLFEGDIVGHPSVLHHQSKQKNAVNNPNNLWTNNEIPYQIEGDFDYEERLLLFQALSEFGARTCNTFRPKVYEDMNFVAIIRGEGCYSSVGMGSGRQTLSIGYGCMYKGTIQHEAMHAVGFWHEQSRYDRDDYVDVHWENIIEGQEHNFDKYSNETITTLGLPYDYESIMHYGTTYFSKNGLETLTVSENHVNENEQVKMGQRDHFTDLDIQKQRKLYNCDASQFVGWSAWSEWSECDAECFHQRWRWCNSESCDGEDWEKSSCSNCQVGYDPDCGVIEHGGKSGTVQSPLYPNNYKNYADCKYKIKAASPDQPIFVSFLKFGIEYEATSCGYDYLDVFKDQAGTAVAHMCGDTLPSDRTIDANELDLIFRSDSSNTGVGFKILYFNVPVIHHWPFEQSLEAYGWTQGTDDDFDWTLQSGPTPSGGTGPTNDHTLNDGTGHYVFIETSSPQYGPMVATLSTPVVEPISGDACVQFFYHMYGQYMGTLNVFLTVFDAAGTPTNSTVFSANGNKGNLWLEHRFAPPNDKKFQMTFEAIRGGGYLSDLAIDDVRILGEKCEELD